jgi:RNA polymerase sigma-70 factor (ECF subfamily)
VRSPPDSFEAGIIAAMPMLKRFAMKLCFDTVRAEDLVQETVMRALEHRADFAPGTNLNAWLTVILRNWYYSDIRKRRREVEDPDDIMANRLLSGDNVIRKIEAREALAMVDMLPENFKKPLLLIADGATMEEVAFEIREHVGTVKSRLNRGRSMLGGKGQHNG